MVRDAIRVRDAFLETGHKLNHYVILERIDLCDQYIDYMGLDRRTKKHVAIKLLLGKFPRGNECYKAYLQQTKIVAALDHRRFIPILDHDLHEGIPYVVTRYIDGYNFRGWLDENRLLDPEKALWFMHGAIDILSYAANFNILHLNIRPVAFVVDWEHKIMAINLGFVQCYHKLRGTEKYDCMRTPEYVAPEMILGRPTDLRTDIYCLGSTLYHLMTGYAPYEGDDSQETCKMHLEAPFPSDKASKIKLPIEWMQLIKKMMNKAPEDRYQNYRELLASVNHLAKIKD